MLLADANRRLGKYAEGISQEKEALKIHERLNRTENQTLTLHILARLLYENKQLSAAAETASKSLGLLPDNGQDFKSARGTLPRQYMSLQG